MFRMYLTTAFPILASWCTFLDRVLLAIWFNFTVNIIKLDNELESYFHWRHSHRCLLTIWKIKFNFRLNLHYEWTQSTPSHEHKFTRTNCSSVFFLANCLNCLQAIQRTLFSMKSPWWIIRGILKIPHYMIFSLEPEGKKMEHHEEWKEFTIWNTWMVDMVGCSLYGVKHEKRES